MADFLSEFVLITGPTNSGKTTLAKSFTKMGFVVFSLDSYYKRYRGVSFFKRKKMSIDALACDLRFALKTKDHVVCEGAQLLEGRTLKILLDVANEVCLSPTVIINDCSFYCVCLFLYRRIILQETDTILAFEKFFVMLITFCYFNLTKHRTFSQLGKNVRLMYNQPFDMLNIKTNNTIFDS